MNIFKDVFVYPGYYLVKNFHREQTKMIENLIFNQINRICAENGQDVLIENPDKDLTNYHQTSFGQNFHHLLTKAQRLFSESDVQQIKDAIFSLDKLKIFQECNVTNEENKGGEEIYWRIVRPNEKGVGNIHADKWFWDLGIGHVEPVMERIKIWVGLIHDRDCGGLELAPGSHLLNYPYNYIDDGNKKRPYLDLPTANIPAFENVGTMKGVIAVFNDRLLHRGVVSKLNTRLSFEFTIEFPRSEINEQIKKSFGVA